MYDNLMRELQCCPDGEYGCPRCEHRTSLHCRETLMKQAADAIEQLLRVAKKMHLWIFLHSGDEQAAYDWCGLSDEMNAALGYGGQFEVKIDD